MMRHVPLLHIKLLKKNCDFVALVFREAIANVGRSTLIIWSDNGLENLGPEMRGIYVQYDIRHIRTKSWRSRINVKIERFCQGINKVVEGKTRWFEIIDAIDTYINYYNNDNHHSGPKNIGLTNSTPKQIFNDPLRQTTDRQNTPFNV